MYVQTRINADGSRVNVVFDDNRIMRFSASGVGSKRRCYNFIAAQQIR